MAVVHRSAADRGRLLLSPLEVFSSGWNNRGLILRLARREVEARYRGSMLGLAWSLLVPLILLAVYTVVFSTIFRSGWRSGFTGKGHFALILFSGLILFNLFAEVVNRAPSLMLENTLYIKKIVFPLEALAWVSIAVAMFNVLVSAAALLAGHLLLIGLPPPSIVLLPVLLVPLILLALACSWVLSSLGVYLRDIQQFVPVLMTVLLYLNPILYDASVVPDRLKFILVLSPLAVTVESARAVLFFREPPHWGLLAWHTGLAWVLAWMGLMWFTKTRKGFSDVV